MKPDPDTAINGPGGVVILNDTSQRSHHGCSRVMRLLVQGLERHGLTVTARSLARHDWQNDRAFVQELERAALIVINGEGTLHHGRKAGERLLAVTQHPAAKGRPIAIVNALYQANPDTWGHHLSACALLSARDDKSADEMRRVCGDVPVRTVPDLSLSAGAQDLGLPRSGIVFGDSVRLNIRRALARAASRLHADRFLPIKTLRNPLLALPPLRWLLYCAYNGVLQLRPPRFELARDEPAYLHRISGAAMHVTGRFHSVCLSLVTGTPFLAVGSNSWKTEALLQQAGVDPSRILTLDDLAALTPDDLQKPFTKAEQKSIARFLNHAQQQADALFADLAELANRGRP